MQNNSQTETFEKLVTIDEVAQHLSIPRVSIFELTRSRCKNPIPAVRIGPKTVRFLMSAVQPWILAQSGLPVLIPNYTVSVAARKNRTLREKDARSKA
jgi:predicted DNA-binding transcriptional regulator AlpA